MKSITKLSDADIKSVGLYILTRIEYHREQRECGPQDFPKFDRSFTVLQAGRCEIVLTGTGGADVDAMSVLVYPPAAIGNPKGICVSEHVRTLVQHDDVTPPTLAGKNNDPLPDPRDIDKTRFECYEKLVRHGQDVPRHLWSGIIAHVEHGQTAGSALNYILEGNLFKAALFADDEVCGKLGPIAKFIAHYMPVGSTGTPESVAHWKRDRMADAKAKAAA